MTKIRRREFLCVASVMPLCVAVSSWGLSDLRVKSPTPSTELLEVLLVWLNEMKKPPLSYLAEKKIDVANKSLIKQCSETDFRTGNTISVRGIILSKTEAALISHSAIAMFL